MVASSRFSCPSASLALRVLLKRRQGALWAVLAVAMACHFGVSQLGGFGTEQKTM